MSEPSTYPHAQYTGDEHTPCAITLAPLCELKWPVVFRHATHQPYECEALVRWLVGCRTDPLTNLSISWRGDPMEAIALLHEYYDHASHLADATQFIWQELSGMPADTPRGMAHIYLCRYTTDISAGYANAFCWIWQSTSRS
jgi:hypothetical protein